MRALINKYREVIAYLFVGGLTTFVSLGSYYLLVTFLLDAENPVQLQATNIISWVLAVTFAYIANRRYVFKSKNTQWVMEAIRFYAARISTLLMDMGIMFAGVTILHFNDKAVKLFVQVGVFVANYLFSKFLVFRKQKRERNS